MFGVRGRSFGANAMELRVLSGTRESKKASKVTGSLEGRGVKKDGSDDALGGRVQKVDGWEMGTELRDRLGEICGCSEAKDQHGWRSFRTVTWLADSDPVLGFPDCVATLRTSGTACCPV